MLFDLFKRRKPRATTEAASHAAVVPSGTMASAAEVSLLREVQVQRASDPMIGAKIGGREVASRMVETLRNERGVHVESLLCALGALAGYACQASVRARAVSQGIAEDEAFVVVGTQDGARYFFGDAINAPLAEAPYSVWALAAGTAQSLGCATLPDCTTIFAHVADTVGGPAFGVPRLDGGYAPANAPIDYLRHDWPAMERLALKFCVGPEELPMVFGISIQVAMEMARDAIDPCRALRLVMECAIPMSKVDLSAATAPLSDAATPAD